MNFRNWQDRIARSEAGMWLRLPRRFLMLVAVPAFLLAFGTVGYRVIEGPTWTWLDCVYMTTITLTTVGFKEVHDLSPTGQVFTMFLAFGGIFVVFYATAEVIRSVVSGEFGRQRDQILMKEKMASLKGHAIVCGMGRMGRLICEELNREETPFVIIDRDAKKTRRGSGGVRHPP